MNKKLKISVVVMAIVLVLLVGNILAYFTDADTATNEFTTGRISIDLQEPSWDPLLGGELVPGYEIPKDPQVLNDGINDAFIFVTIDVPYQNVTTTDELGNKLQPTDTELFSYDVKDGWVQVGDPVVETENEVVGYVYAYAQDNEMTTLAPNDTTPTVFDYIRFEGVVEDEGLEELRLDVAVNAYGIQTDNIDGGKTSPEDVWPIVKNSNGPIALEDIVIDFGLPVEIPVSQLGEDPIVEKLSYATYGTVAIDGDSSKGDFTVIYTPTEILQGIDTVYLITESGKEYTFNVYPATTVYYEESFISNDGWTTLGTNNATTQSHNILGRSSDLYGYDKDYLNNIGPSANTHEMSTDMIYSGKIEFTGTGFELYANCMSDAEQTYISCRMYDSKGNNTRNYLVDTGVYDGNTDETSYDKKNYYNRVVLDCRDLVYDTYFVTFRIMKDVYIDGVKIYGTLEDQSVYASDLESNPKYHNIRNMVLNSLVTKYGIDESTQYGSLEEMANIVYNNLSLNGEQLAVILTDHSNVSSSDTMTDEEKVQDLLNNGPKGEIYLRKGQTVVLNVTTDGPMQVGLSVPTEETTYTMTLNGQVIEKENRELKSSVDMFYSLENEIGVERDNTLTITNTGNNILAVKDLKICNDPDAKFNNLTEIDIEYALNVMGYNF